MLQFVAKRHLICTLMDETQRLVAKTSYPPKLKPVLIRQKTRQVSEDNRSSKINSP